MSNKNSDPNTEWICSFIKFYIYNHNRKKIIVLKVRIFPVAQTVKNLPAMQETWVQFWVWKILGEGNGNLFSILAWRIPWTDEPGGPQSMESQRVRHDWATNTNTTTTTESKKKLILCSDINVFFKKAFIYV